METSVHLQNMLRYDLLPIIMIAGILAVITIVIIVMLLLRIRKNRKSSKKNTVKELLWTKPDITKLKQEYLARLYEIESRFDADRTRIRPSYEQMSVLVRDFAFKATGIEVDKYTLYEIRQTHLQKLADLVEEYYEPEFDKISSGDVKASIEKTRRLIAEWN